MIFRYDTIGTCSNEIIIDVDENERKINSVAFTGGCHGNLQGISALVKDREIEEVIKTLKGIDCRGKGTSCPDQLARALEDINEEL